MRLSPYGLTPEPLSSENLLLSNRVKCGCKKNYILKKRNVSCIPDIKVIYCEGKDSSFKQGTLPVKSDLRAQARIVKGCVVEAGEHPHRCPPLFHVCV